MYHQILSQVWQVCRSHPTRVVMRTCPIFANRTRILSAESFSRRRVMSCVLNNTVQYPQSAHGLHDTYIGSSMGFWWAKYMLPATRKSSGLVNIASVHKTPSSFLIWKDGVIATTHTRGRQRDTRAHRALAKPLNAMWRTASFPAKSRSENGGETQKTKKNL